MLFGTLSAFYVLLTFGGSLLGWHKLTPETYMLAAIWFLLARKD